MRVTWLSIIALTLANPASAQVASRPAIQSGASVQTPAKKPKLSDSEAEGAKARAANDAREKAWEARTKKAMGGICTGC
jgi:hypothetical protein